MRRDWIDALRAVGVNDAQIAAAEKSVVKKSRPKPNYIDGCPGCGQKIADFDYVCGACGRVKADRPRRFHQYEAERAKGGQGRTIDKPLTDDEKRAIAVTDSRLAALANAKKKTPDMIVGVIFDGPTPKPKPPTRYEWFVTFDRHSVVVVAELAYQAVNMGLRYFDLPETATAHWLCMGETDAPNTTISDLNAPAHVERGENG